MGNKREIAWHKGELNKHLSSLKDELNSVKSQKISEMQTQIQSIKEYYERLKISSPSLESEIDEMVEKLKEYNEKYSQIEIYYEEIFNSSENEKGIRDKIEEFEKMIISYKDELLFGKDGKKSIKRKIEEKYEEILEYHNNIFGIKELKDEEGNKTPGIPGFKKELEDFKSENETEFLALKQKIESLLPGATSAGLSTAYKEMKDSFNTSIEKWERMFVLSTVGMVLVSMELLFLNGGVSDLSLLLMNSPLYLPLIWLTYFSSKQQSQNKRLQQEYAHKESLAKSFEGYKNQIDNLGEDERSLEIKKMLMGNIVQMTGENPSDTLDKNHGTRPPIWEYLFGGRDKE